MSAASGTTADGSADAAAGTTADDATAHPAGGWAVRVGSDVLAPANVIIALAVVLGYGEDGWPGVGWGLCAALFAGILPTLWIRLGLRRARYADRFVGERRQRPRLFAGIIGSVVAGAVLMALLGAPRVMLGLLAAMFATLLVVVVITLFWKVSVHTAVAAGALTMLALAFGPWWCCGAPLVGWIGWSRVRQRDHTPAQTLVGAAVGLVVSLLSFGLAR